VPNDGPLAAFGLSLAGGILILVGGFLLAIVSGVAASVGAGAAGAILGGFALVGVLLGFLIVILAILLYITPEHHSAYGVVIIILSLVSIFGGGGFLIGIVLGVVGGVLAVRFDEEEVPIFEWEENRYRLGAPGTPTTAPRTTPAGVCANCHSRYASGADRCPNCETPVPRAARPPPPGPSAAAKGRDSPSP
jgi:hypothetical protein